MIASTSSDTRNVETVFWGSWRFLFGSLLCAGAVGAAIFVVRNGGGAEQLVAAITSFLENSFFDSLPASLLLRWVCHVRVSAHGIKGLSDGGIPISMTWSEIEKVEPYSVLGIQCLRVRSSEPGRPVLCIARILSRPDAFRECVAGYTPADHPLRRSLENGYSGEKREAQPAR